MDGVERLGGESVNRIEAAQYDGIMDSICFNDANWEGFHSLQKRTMRSWKHLFRRTVWWKCWQCKGSWEAIDERGRLKATDALLRDFDRRA